MDLSEKMAKIWKKNGQNLEKMVGIWKKGPKSRKNWPNFDGHWTSQVSRVLEEKIRNLTRRNWVFGVRT